MDATNKIGSNEGLGHLLREGEKRVEFLLECGLECVQLCSFDATEMTKENCDRVKELLKGKLEISSFWAGWSGPQAWDFIDGVHTLGLVPETYRNMRIAELKKGADFAEMLGVEDVVTHVGYVPEQPTDPLYRGLKCAVKEVAQYCKDKGLHFCFETGQETPTTLMRLFNDVGLDNIGVNLDPANLIMYGKANPVDAIDIFGDKIRSIHVKDGDYPKGDFYKLGEERVVGEGTVNYPVFLPKLLKQGFKRYLFIEREIKGEQQIIDMKKTVKYVKDLMKDVL